MTALELSHISKRYNATTALDDVGLLVRPGTIHALLGENGAGKTTLMQIVYGMIRPDAGRIHLDGHDVRFSTPSDAIAAGIGMVHQHFTLVPAMTIAENLSLGGSGPLRNDDMAARVRAAAKRIGFALDPSARVETLPVGAQQRVEIAKALVRDAGLLILDEPTAVLAPAEIEELLRWLRDYVASGNAAVLITHKLHEALAVATDVTVLRRGHMVHTGLVNAMTPELLSTAMIGSTEFVKPRSYVKPRANTRHTVIRAHSISVGDRDGHVRVKNASFSVQAGEMVGVAAVEGSGHRELLRALAGRCAISAGRLERPTHVGFVPEDRHRDAVLLRRSLTENVALRGVGKRSGIVSWTALRDSTMTLMREFDIRGSTTRDRLQALSGGNQQKLVLAREFASVPGEPAPEALVVENPTRGLDVRATADVHLRLHAACEHGAAVVLYSSDLDEVLALASRMLVMFAGYVHEVPLNRDAIGRAMLGLS